MKNSSFLIESTTLSGPKILTPFILNDERGSFLKEFGDLFSEKLSFVIKESFYTYSKKNVIRALHFQIIKPQAKLIRCLKGSIFDVIVDLRKGSKDYGKWESFLLSELNNKILYIPEGFAHGYLVLEESIVSYKCNEYFVKEFDSGIRFNDEKINIPWPIKDINAAILSEKDKNLITFENFDKINSF